MTPNLASSTQANILIYVGGGGFALLGSFFFGRLVTFFFPKNPLIKNGKKEKDEWACISNIYLEILFLLEKMRIQKFSHMLDGQET